MRHIIIFIFLHTGLFLNPFLSGQGPGTGVSGILGDLYRRLVISNCDSEKLRINDSVRLIIDSYAGSDTVFSHRFNDLRHLGQLTSPDRKIKIINWNLILSDSKNRYFCYIIYQAGKGKEKKIYRLETIYRDTPVRSDTTYAENDWYGALYYDLRPSKKSDRESWIILGIDFSNPVITRKIIDVISFTPGGDIMFGKNWFASDRDIRFREVFEYSSEAVMSLRFASDRSIVFDHLVPISPDLAGNRQFYGPDYSYDAYNFKDGMWRLELNTDVRNKK